MRWKIGLALLVTAMVGRGLSAHIMVSPPQSTSGTTQKYEVRVHNEEKIAATSIELEVPEAATVLDVGKPPTGTVSTVTG